MGLVKQRAVRLAENETTKLEEFIPKERYQRFDCNLQVTEVDHASEYQGPKTVLAMKSISHTSSVASETPKTIRAHGTENVDMGLSYTSLILAHGECSLRRRFRTGPKT